VKNRKPNALFLRSVSGFCGVGGITSGDPFFQHCKCKKTIAEKAIAFFVPCFRSLKTAFLLALHETKKTAEKAVFFAFIRGVGGI
jgi:hypothetical protein